MKSVLYVIRVLYRKKWWLIFVPLVAAIIVAIIMSGRPRQYKSETTIYTGIVSGYNVLGEGGQDWLTINNALDNLMSICKAESTLEIVSLRLLARNMLHIDTEKDNQYMTAESSRELEAMLPKYIRHLAVKDDEDATYEKLRKEYSLDKNNFLYRLFHWNNAHYSYKALNSIDVHRISSSDMVSMSYINDDPYIVYNTLLLLTDAFIEQYQYLRYEQTNNVIAYFEEELDKIGRELRGKEEKLTNFNINNLIINYEEQTKMVAERSRDLEVREETVMMNYVGAMKLRQSLEDRLEGRADIYKDNAEFLSKLKNIGTLYSSSAKGDKEDSSLDAKIASEEQALKNLTSSMFSKRYSTEGLASADLATQWLDAVLLEKKSEAELRVLAANRVTIDKEFERFSPVGSSIKRQNRDINFSEQSYLSILEALNEARLRQKNLQLTSATFKVLSPPAVAIEPEASKTAIFVLITFMAVFFFMLVIFIIAEIMNRKPYNKQIAERLTKSQVLGAYPILNGRRYDEVCQNLAMQQIGNSILNYLDRSKTNNIINIFSIVGSEGKTKICEGLVEYFKGIDMKPIHISWNKDFDATSKAFLMSWSIYDFAQTEDNIDAIVEANVTIVEYPPLAASSIPTRLIGSGAVNIVIADATTSWKTMNQTLLKQLKFQAVNGNIPVVLCLNKAEVDAVGTFTGMLPPYNLRHRIHFTMENLGMGVEG